MTFFTPADHDAAVQAMLDHPDVGSRHLRGLMGGIKRRARARAVIAFVQAIAPPPPDATITTTRQLMRALFGHAVSVNDLHRHFATPGRRANDRADAEARMLELEIAWQRFTAAAAEAAGEIRTAARPERRGDV